MLYQTVTSTDYIYTNFWFRKLLVLATNICSFCSLFSFVRSLPYPKNHIKGYFKLYNFIHVNCISFALITHTHMFWLHDSWSAAIKLIGFEFLMIQQTKNIHWMSLNVSFWLRWRWWHRCRCCLCRQPIPIKLTWLLSFIFYHCHVELCGERKRTLLNSSLKLVFFGLFNFKENFKLNVFLILCSHFWERVF